MAAKQRTECFKVSFGGFAKQKTGSKLSLKFDGMKARDATHFLKMAQVECNLSAAPAGQEKDIPGQKTMGDMNLSLDAIGEISKYTDGTEITCSVSFPFKSVDWKKLGEFAHRSGTITMKKVGEIEHKGGVDPDKVEEELEEEED